MELYVSKSGAAGEKRVALDDMLLTKDLPTTAGSKMLEGFVSLFPAEVVTKLTAAGYTVAGKANVGELGMDVIGETSCFGAVTREDGSLTTASALLVESGEVTAAVQLDVNGAPRRAAAQGKHVFVKPTYGTVSRYGTIPAACSGETVGVAAVTAAAAREVLAAMVGHDDKDGTSQPLEKCALVTAAGKAVKRVAIAKGLVAAADAETREKVAKVCEKLRANGVETVEADDTVLLSAKTAWNVLMSAEICNNVSRYDGVKYGYRSPNYTNIDELYTNSRTEAFGDLLKTAILFGSDVLSTENYMTMYDKALRVRRVVAEAFTALFADVDCVLMPAVSTQKYTAEKLKATPFAAYEENLFTAPASLTGLPAVVAGGVQLVGPAFSDNALLDVAAMCEEASK